MITAVLTGLSSAPVRRERKISAAAEAAAAITCASVAPFIPSDGTSAAASVILSAAAKERTAVLCHVLPFAWKKVA